MGSNVLPSLSTNYLSGTTEPRSLSIALIGPDQSRRRMMSLALAEDGRASVSEFESYPKRSDQLLWLTEQSFDVIVLDLDCDPNVVLELVGKFSVNESATVMVYSEQADTKLAVRCVRAGASEFLLLPLEAGVVTEALERAREIRVEKTQPAQATAGHLFAFVCAKGGCGATTIACNLAIALAADTSQKTLLIDLALPIGDAALALGVAAEYSTEDAIRNAGLLDTRILNQLLVKHRSGLYVLAAPSDIPGTKGSGDAIDKLIAVARSEFDHVIVDVGSRIDLMGTTLFRQASTVYLVTLSGVSELRNSNRLISQFFPAGGPNLEIVINRFESYLLRIKEDDLARALGRPVRWTAPEDRDVAREMQNGEIGTGSTRISRLSMEMAAAITDRAVLQEKKKDSRPRVSIKAESCGEYEMPDVMYVPPVIAPPAFAPATPVIRWPMPAQIAYGEALSAAQLNATASIAGTLVYSPPSGNVLPAGTHELSVSFTPANSEHYTAAQATVTLAVERATPAMAWLKPGSIAYGTALGAGQLNATASVPGRFDYSPAPGEVLAAGTHTLSVIFTPEESENYVTVKRSVPIVVKSAAPALAWSSLDPMLYGTPVSDGHLCATAAVPGKFEYSVKPGEMLDAGSHTLTARFTPTDSANYTSAEASVELIVDRATPVITWSSPDPIPNGTHLSEMQLCATASVPGRLDYSPASGAVLGAGMHGLSVTFTPADTKNYTKAEAEVTLHVAKALPVLEWTNPDPIRYGTKLSAKQLCAMASVPGEFDYTPALGEVLTAGTHTLSATFIPADSANFAPVRETVSLEVAKAIPSVAWPAPHSLRSSTVLGDQHLCATSPLPGKFEYTPGPGKALLAGTHTLSVTFTPTDTENYATTHATVTIKVVDRPVPAAGKPSAYSDAAEKANDATTRGAASQNVEKATSPIEWPSPPEPIEYNTASSAAQFDATPPSPAVFKDVLADGEVLVPRMQTRAAIPPLPDAETLKPAQAKAEPQAERGASEPPDSAKVEKFPEPVQKSEPAPRPAPAAEATSMVDPLDWLIVPADQPRASGYGREVSETKEAGHKKWIFVGAGALLLLCILWAFFFVHSRPKSSARGTTTQVPVTADAQSSSDESTAASTLVVTPNGPITPANAAKPSPGQSQDAQAQDQWTHAPVLPNQVQTDMMRNQLNAPARIPQGAQKQGASNAPPPTNFSADGLGGNSAMANVFGGGRAPTVVAAAPHGPVSVPGDIAMRFLIQKRLPEYPANAKLSRVSGTVQLDATISKDGKIEALHVASGPAMLRDAALYAVRTWRYRPYILNNQPVEVQTTINVAFSLDQ